MLPRVTAKAEGSPAKVVPNERSRFFMHPGADKPTTIEFDTKGLTSLTLAPFMEDFRSDTNCVKAPEAGIARLSWSVDAGKNGQVMVDKNYNGTVDVDVANSTRLKLATDKGNGVTWCDWLSVGFLNVK
jgi:hypothetical protein